VLTATTISRPDRGLLPLAAPRGLGPAFWAGLATIAALTLAAVAAPLIAPYDPNSIDLAHVLQGPSAAHLLGSDAAGRDIASRLLYGARTSLLGPLGVIAVSLALGIPTGLLAAARGGLADTAISRCADLLLSFPGLLFAILAVALFGAGFSTAVLALAIAYAPTVTRLVRSLALGEQERDYVKAYRVAGFGETTIYTRHILPNISGVVLGHSVVQFGYALMDLAVLSFLGFGVQPPAADWGAMVNDGQNALLQGAPAESLFAGAAIILTVLAFNLCGLALSDALGAGAGLRGEAARPSGEARRRRAHRASAGAPDA
jgi:peptide/nickel transport system permease protein